MFAIAPADRSWFLRLREEPHGGIVNFWTPTPWSIRRLQPGDRFYFMLKAPVRRIGGYGTFSGYFEMSASDAWSRYGLGNGISSRDELISKIHAFAVKRSKNFVAHSNPPIGCIELADVVTFDDDSFIDPSEYGYPFPDQVVRLKYFPEHDRIAELLASDRPLIPFSLVQGSADKKSTLRKDRKGQSIFRQTILKNYGHRCCISGDAVVELLEAAYIQPYVNEHSNHPQNGLCLRVDLHRLFDQGLMSVSTQHTVEVSSLLRDTSYSSLAGRRVSLPTN